jgi:hypothetical protein
MAGNYYDDPAHAAVTKHIYSLLHGGKRTSTDELGDMLSAIVTEAHPVAGLIFEAGRAAMSKNNSDDE